MTPLYLKRVALRQFRSFATLDVELAAQPGVLIVHGSNGLGKSSLFDALEWALSDRIDHFRDAAGVNKPGTYLCRWRDSEPGPTSTTMTFSDDSVIERSLLSAKSTKSQLSGNVPDITAYLRAPAWQQNISELQRYLLLTHFLGQSTLSRLTYRKSTERFDILKEAAQSTSVEAIATALHGQGNNTVVRAYARQIEELEREVKVLGDLLEHEAALWNEAQLSGVIDDAAAAIIVRRIAEQLKDAQLGSLPSSETSSPDLDPTINGLQAKSDQIERDCLKAETQIREAKKLHGDMQRLLTDIAEIVASRLTSQARIDAITQGLGEARARQIERRAEVAHQRALATQANASLARLQDLRDARSRVARLAKDHRDAVAALAVAEQAKDAAERNLVRVERLQQATQRLGGEISSSDAELARLRIVTATFDDAIASDERIREQTATLDRLESANPAIDQAVDRTAASVTAAEAGVSAQTVAVEALRETVDTLSTAIASIATHLPADACDCPVCATHFPRSSELHARVSTAAQRLAPTLLVQEEALRDIVTIRDSQTSKLQVLKAAQTEIRTARAALDAERQVRAGLISRLGWTSTDEEASLSDGRARLADDIAALERRRLRKMRWRTLLSSGGISSRRPDRENAIRSRDGAQRTVESARRSAGDLAVSLDRANADEAAKQSAVDTLGKIAPDMLAELLHEAEGDVSRSQGELNAAAKALADADAIVTEFEAEHAGLRARLVENDTRRTALEELERQIRTDWLELGRFGIEPDLLPVQAFENRVSTSGAAAREVQGQLTRLREGRLAWARQVSHRATLEQVREQVDGPPSGTREELLASALTLLEKYRADVEAIRRVKEIARSASAEISLELENFNSDYIKPLGFLMSQINQAILCDPRVGIDLHVRKKKIEQSAVKEGEVPKAVGEIDPVLVHSEGQMAALAVSMLCAASLTFPWSRWKALILDDPLQHNDSIHAAAFADLMGNLVSAEGYQVFISTHDVAQAEFLQRKFRSRRIPCTTLSLLGIGKEGVEWSVQNPLLGSLQAASA